MDSLNFKHFMELNKNKLKVSIITGSYYLYTTYVDIMFKNHTFLHVYICYYCFYTKSKNKYYIQNILITI